MLKFGAAQFGRGEDFMSRRLPGSIFVTGNVMKNYGTLAMTTIALLAAGCLMVPTALRAADTPDSVEVTKLLADTKSTTAQLKADSAQMESFTRSGASWPSY